MYNNKKIINLKIAIKGAGDIASGIAHRLFKSNISNLYLMEIEKPVSIRRLVSFSEAVYTGKITIEGITGIFVKSIYEAKKIFKIKKIPILVDPLWNTPKIEYPDVLIDATMAKKNLGTNIKDAKLVIGLGPGFNAGKDVNIVIETKRGHNLGKILKVGKAQKNTSIPEQINSFTFERVIKSPINGIFTTKNNIGDIIKKGDTIGKINRKLVKTKINGVIRGLLHTKIKVKKNMKIADIDPRKIIFFCKSISDKARSLGGSVLEVILEKFNL